MKKEEIDIEYAEAYLKMHNLDFKEEAKRNAIRAALKYGLIGVDLSNIVPLWLSIVQHPYHPSWYSMLVGQSFIAITLILIAVTQSFRIYKQLTNKKAIDQNIIEYVNQLEGMDETARKNKDEKAKKHFKRLMICLIIINILEWIIVIGRDLLG